MICADRWLLPQTFGTTPDEDFDPIVLAGTDVTVVGAPGNVIDGNGQAYWDGQGSNGGRPKYGLLQTAPISGTAY